MALHRTLAFKDARRDIYREMSFWLSVGFMVTHGSVVAMLPRIICYE